ncbi:B12-binding domain-containing radical SAM protein [Thermoanaerobacterium sp. PSU-2]|uniref:B12-binding domain-containing radical SAM protein n=1 Tax=Thermoanaerobacterium sp. PSU-2 TaxID=1930849 RepID=UPI000A1502E3|nr:B12-binding domain-containing radical SAM protein [Thermoanaerobacterium sp. PSU-2]ORX23999.1 B12-binding domain-containing radical SAM protein [Thermoanaerobacterium sp. PSU-2]
MKTLLVALNAKYYHTNLAIRNIKLYCKPIDIQLLEMTINDDLDLILHNILNKRPDVIGFSCYIWNIDKVLKLCEYIKKVNKDILIVLGGPEISFDSDDLLKIGVADFIVLGEGEATFKNLLQKIHNGENVYDLNGISYMKDGKVILRENTDYVCLDDIPFPYGGEDISNKLVYYETSRGCPFRCSYCLSSLDNKLRYASIEKVRDDLEKLTNMGAKIVKLIDRSFDSNIKRAVEILDIIRGMRSDTVFHCEVNPELVNQEFIDSLKGIEDRIQFEVGIQTTNKETLKNVSRNPDVSGALNGIKLIINAGVKVHVDLIAGLPGDDFDSIVKSFNDVYKLNPDEIQLGFLKLLKGTRIRKNKDIYGIKYKSDPPYEVLMTNTISYMELYELKNIAFLVDKYYNSGKFKMSLRFLLDFFKDPFELYSRLNCFWEENGFYGKKHSLNDLFDIIYRFAFSEGVDTDYFKDYLRFDYLYSTNNKAYPDCLKEDKKVPDEVKSLLRNDEWLKRNLPAAVGMSNSEKNKNLSIGFFKHDVLNIEGGNVYIAFFHCDDKTYCAKINV